MEVYSTAVEFYHTAPELYSLMLHLACLLNNDGVALNDHNTNSTKPFAAEAGYP